MEDRLIKKYLPMAEAGDPEAQYQMGLCFYPETCGPPDGKGAQKWTEDMAKSIHWFQQASEQGHPAATQKLGFCYHIGKGVPENYEMAVKYHRKAALGGNAEAQWWLGTCYLNGMGVPEDENEGFRWMNEAAVGGDMYGQSRMAFFCLGWKGSPLKRDLKMRWEWLNLAAEQGHAGSLADIAECYFRGDSVERNFEKACEYMSLAVASKKKYDPDSCDRYSERLKFFRDTEYNFEQSLKPIAEYPQEPEEM